MGAGEAVGVADDLSDFEDRAVGEGESVGAGSVVDQANKREQPKEC